MYKSYDELPIIKIKSNPFVISNSVSHGIILQAQNTQRWLVVQQRYTYAYFQIVKGKFYGGQIFDLIRRLSYQETQKIVSLLRHCDMRSRLIKLYLSIFRQVSLSELNYALTMLQEFSSTILNLIDHNSRRKDETEWFWPKGQAQRGEESLDAALREFREEVKIDLTRKRYRVIKPMHQTVVDKNGRSYRTVLWLCCIDEEFFLPEVTKKDVEIRQRVWVTTEFLRQHFSSDKLKALEKCQSEYTAWNSRQFPMFSS